MTLLLFLRAYWKPLCILVLLTLGWATLARWGTHREQEGYERAQAEAKAELEKAREHWDELKAEIDRERYEEKAQLQNRVNHLLARGTPIRLCPSANQVRTPPSPGSAPGTSPNAGQAPGAGDDLRPRLVNYGASCEDLRQRLEKVQRWYASAGLSGK